MSRPVQYLWLSVGDRTLFHELVPTTWQARCWYAIEEPSPSHAVRPVCGSYCRYAQSWDRSGVPEVRSRYKRDFFGSGELLEYVVHVEVWVDRAVAVHDRLLS